MCSSIFHIQSGIIHIDRVIDRANKEATLLMQSPAENMQVFTHLTSDMRGCKLETVWEITKFRWGLLLKMLTCQ